MRSRYAAFTRRDEAYLLTTWHRDTRPAAIEFDAQRKWLGLRVVAGRDTGPDAAVVEFVARYRIGGGSAARHHEVSNFVREGGRWFYVDGSVS